MWFLAVPLETNFCDDFLWRFYVMNICDDFLWRFFVTNFCDKYFCIEYSFNLLTIALWALGSEYLWSCFTGLVISFHTLEMSCLRWTGSSQLYWGNAKWKYVLRPHYLKILMKLSKHGISYSLRRDPRSIIKALYQ